MRERRTPQQCAWQHGTARAAAYSAVIDGVRGRARTVEDVWILGETVVLYAPEAKREEAARGSGRFVSWPCYLRVIVRRASRLCMHFVVVHV